MKNSMALTLLRVCQSSKMVHAATPLLREFVATSQIGRIDEHGVSLSAEDKRQILSLLMQHQLLRIDAHDLHTA